MSDASSPSEHKAKTTSLGDLISEVSRDISTLMRQELELAKAELKQSAKDAGRAAGMFSGAAYAAMMAVLFLSIAAWWGLGYLVGNAWSGLIIAAIWAIIAVVLGLVGRARAKEIKGAPQTVESLKEIPNTLKRNGEDR
jgi:hypothetical protein